MAKRFVLFNTKEGFSKATLGTEYDNNSIVFIKDSKEIWTHGTFFATPIDFDITDYLTIEDAQNTYQPLLPSGNKDEVLTKTQTGVEWQKNTIIKDSEGNVITELVIEDDDTEGSLLTKEVADTIYQPIGDYLTEHQDLSDYATKNEVKEGLDKKQDKFTIGTGLELKEGTLNVTLDTTIFKVVEELPDKPATGDENKLHLVLSDASETCNLYEEYLYVDNKWELLGKFKAEIDLSPYVKDEDLDDKVTELGYAKSEDVTEEINDAVDDMATMTWVESQEYLTAHQSLENYYTKTQTDSAIATALDWAEY